MNLDDLRSVLNTRADDIGAQAAGRMAGIRARAARRRRRKAAVAVAGTVAAVAVVATSAGTLLSPDVDPSHDAAASVAFPDVVDGDTLIASEIGDNGDSSVTLTFTPQDTDFLLDLNCSWARNSPRVVQMSVNGNGVRPLCEPGSDTTDGDRGRDISFVGGVAKPGVVRGYWDELGVEPDEPVEITLEAKSVPGGPLHERLSELEEEVATLKAELADSKKSLEAVERGGRSGDAEEKAHMLRNELRAGRRNLRAARAELRAANAESSERLGIGVYEMTGDRVDVNGVALPRQRTFEGEKYELADGGYSVVGSGSTRLDVPESDDPALVTFGAQQTYLGRDTQATVDGDPGVLTSDQVGIAGQLLPDSSAHTVSIGNAGFRGDKLVLAYYTRID